MKIGIACGGTGGHISPGLAVAEELCRRGHTVALWMAGKPGEDLALAGWNGPVMTVYARGLSSYSPQVMITTCFRLVWAVLQCRQSLKRFSPDVLLAMGSYASVGPVLAARWLNIPVVLHEANVIPGRAIRFLCRWAAAVAVGFDETRRHLAHHRLVVTGMPVRGTREQTTDAGCQTPDKKCRMQNEECIMQNVGTEWMQTRPDAGHRTPEVRGQTPDADAGNRKSEIENRKSEINALGALAPNTFTLLVMGGSRGAHRLNEVVSQAIIRLHREGKPLQVIHLAGLKDEQFIRQAYHEVGMPHVVFGFLRDMPPAYQMASLAICRSGASTCAELSFYGVPALLVPYPFAIYQHQTANADALSSAGAADICDEQILTVDWLVGYVADLMRAPARLANMRTAALRRVTNNPASTLADLVEEIAKPSTAEN